MAEQAGMTEPSDVSATESGESTAGTEQTRKALLGLKLPSALHTIAFSTAVAVLTGI
jgi:hypothetical protein